MSSQSGHQRRARRQRDPQSQQVSFSLRLEEVFVVGPRVEDGVIGQELNVSVGGIAMEVDVDPRAVMADQVGALPGVDDMPEEVALRVLSPRGAKVKPEAPKERFGFTR